MPPEAQLEAHRKKVKFRLGERAMGYPELWTPAETEEEERLIEEAAAEAFTQAVNAGDFKRADAIAQDLHRLFGEPLLEVSSKPAEPEAERQPSAVEQELQNIVDPYWRKISDEIESHDDGHGEPHTLTLILEAKNFDQKRFDIEVKLDQYPIEKIVERINLYKDHRNYFCFLHFAESLKKLVGTKEFEKLIPMDENCWRQLIKDLKTFCHPRSHAFRMALARMMEIDPQKTRELIGEEEIEKIKNIMREVIESNSSPIYKVDAFYALKKLWREGEVIPPPISKKDWELIKNSLTEMLSWHHHMDEFFTLANIIREIGVEES